LSHANPRKIFFENIRVDPDARGVDYFENVRIGATVAPIVALRSTTTPSIGELSANVAARPGFFPSASIAASIQTKNQQMTTRGGECDPCRGGVVFCRGLRYFQIVLGRLKVLSCTTVFS
jgi:hypothetical protein